MQSSCLRVSFCFCAFLRLLWLTFDSREGAPFDKLRMEGAKEERQATPRDKGWNSPIPLLSPGFSCSIGFPVPLGSSRVADEGIRAPNISCLPSAPSAHRPPLTAHCSPLTVHNSQFTIQRAPFAQTQGGPLIVHCSLLTVHCPRTAGRKKGRPSRKLGAALRWGERVE